MPEHPRDDDEFVRALGPRLHDLAWAQEQEEPWADPLPGVRRRAAAGSDEAPRVAVTGIERDDGLDERWPRRRRTRRIRTALAVAAGVVVLGGLGALAAVTGFGQATSDSASGGVGRGDTGGAAAAPEVAGACAAVPTASATTTTLRTTVTSPRRTIQPTATSTATVRLAGGTLPTTVEASAYVRRGAQVVGVTLPVTLSAVGGGDFGTFDVPMIGCDGAGLSPGDYTVVVVVRYAGANGGSVVLVSTGSPVTVT